MMSAPVYNWNGLYVGGIVGVVTNFDPVWSNGVPAADATLGGNSRGTIGGTIGYNWQMASWILGLEADWSWANTSSSTTTAGCAGNPCTTTMNNVGTARARIGYLVMPSLLIYGTGGFAWAGIHNTFLTADIRTTDSGYTFGGGAEWMFAPHWTVKAEYLRLHLNDTLACGVPPCGLPVNATHMNADMFRVGANYLFNWPR